MRETWRVQQEHGDTETAGECLFSKLEQRSTLLSDVFWDWRGGAVDLVLGWFNNTDQ